MEMPMNTRAVWALAGCLLALGCSESPPTGTLAIRNDGSQQRLEMRAILPGPVHHSGLGEASRKVVRTESQWQALWPQIVRSQPTPPAPAVDFAQEMVVVAAMGGRATGGYVITVDSATAASDAIHVYVTERSPGLGCLTTQAFTAPLDAVALPDDGRAVRFHETTTVRGCG
jgi:hypothetical protein